jgi:hypothetical protein
MRPVQFTGLVQSAIRHNEEIGRRNGPAAEYVRIGVEGEPGIGKSAIIAQAARGVGYSCDTFLASMRDPTDLSGGMYADGQYTGWLRPRFLPEGDDKTVLLLDEMGQAHLSMQNACANLHLDRKAGSHPVGRYTTLIAAWNPSKSRAGSTRLPSQYLNRLMKVELQVSKADWVEHAASAGYDNSVTFFIDFSGDKALHDFEPQRDVNATPRAWEAVSQTLTLGLPYDVESEAIAGLVGVEKAAAFNGFRRLKNEIGNPREILKSPDAAEISTRREVQYCTLLMLSQLVDRQTFGNALKYAARIPSKELEMFFVKTLLKRDEGAAARGEQCQHYAKTDAFKAWCDAGNVRFLA